jgi:hypothetical protein
MEAWRHYERAIDAYLRSRGVAYVGVEQARMLLCPPVHTGLRGRGRSPAARVADPASRPLKFFDFVVYSNRANLLVEVKGRRIATFSTKDRDPDRAPSPAARMECWVTRDDVDSLLQWQRLFGPGFHASFVFVYWCEDEPPGVLFQEVFEFERRWYALRSITLADYLSAMKTRSERWRTLDLAQDDFERLSRPFTPDLDSDPAHAMAPGVVVPLESRSTVRSLKALSKPAACLPDGLLVAPSVVPSAAAS